MRSWVRWYRPSDRRKPLVRSGFELLSATRLAVDYTFALRSIGFFVCMPVTITRVRFILENLPLGTVL